jgi:CDGSH-type Zn-finger protein
MKKEKKILITKNGPYLVSGSIPLKKEIAEVGQEDEPETWRETQKFPLKDGYALCRCGHSKNKPYCDGSHLKVNFDGTDEKERSSFSSSADVLEGPELDLADETDLCSSARFCHLSGGTWSNVENSDDQQAKKIAIQTAGDCPSGRLVVYDKKTQKPIEPKFDKSISITEDPQAQVSGPIWAKGGIKIESTDGEKYETRNRVTLCRCGKSRNKPFCDGAHIEAGFDDGDESLK